MKAPPVKMADTFTRRALRLGLIGQTAPRGRPYTKTKRDPISTTNIVALGFLALAKASGIAAGLTMLGSGGGLTPDQAQRTAYFLWVAGFFIVLTLLACFKAYRDQQPERELALLERLMLKNGLLPEADQEADKEAQPYRSGK